jgi:hypothetical protein
MDDGWANFSLDLVGINAKHGIHNIPAGYVLDFISRLDGIAF